MTLDTARPLIFLGAENLGPVRPFYENVLGLPFIAEEPGALVFDMNGNQLRISQVEGFKPQRFTVLGWSVADIAHEAKRLRAAGVVPITYPTIPQDDAGIAVLDGVRLLWFTDPAGNLLSFTEI